MLNFPPVTFLKSAAQLDHLPQDKGSEVAFIGRSNSGKSTAINAITGIKGLARASKTPGRTQLLNFFQINLYSQQSAFRQAPRDCELIGDTTENSSATSIDQRLVDLPGYGYANVNAEKKEDWEEVTFMYLKSRRSLKGLIITMDSRHPLKERDQSMLFWALHYQIPTYILLTKTDKLTRQHSLRILKEAEQQLLKLTPMTKAQLFSATKGIGLKSARQVILNWLNNSTS